MFCFSNDRRSLWVGLGTPQFQKMITSATKKFNWAFNQVGAHFGGCWNSFRPWLTPLITLMPLLFVAVALLNQLYRHHGWCATAIVTTQSDPTYRKLPMAIWSSAVEAERAVTCGKRHRRRRRSHRHYQIEYLFLI
jgi:hypothetical protein